MLFPGKIAVLLVAVSMLAGRAFTAEIELGPRPYFLIQQMRDGALKEKLLSARTGTSSANCSRLAIAVRH